MNSNRYKVLAVVGDNIENVLGTIESEVNKYFEIIREQEKEMRPAFEVGAIQIVPIMLPDPNVKLFNGKGQVNLVPRFYAHVGVNVTLTDLSELQGLYNCLLQTGMKSVEEIRPNMDPDPR